MAPKSEAFGINEVMSTGENRTSWSNWVYLEQCSEITEYQHLLHSLLLLNCDFKFKMHFFFWSNSSLKCMIRTVLSCVNCALLDLIVEQRKNKALIHSTTNASEHQALHLFYRVLSLHMLCTLRFINPKILWAKTTMWPFSMTNPLWYLLQKHMLRASPIVHKKELVNQWVIQVTKKS